MHSFFSLVNSSAFGPHPIGQSLNVEGFLVLGVHLASSIFFPHSSLRCVRACARVSLSRISGWFLGLGFSSIADDFLAALLVFPFFLPDLDIPISCNQFILVIS